MRMALLQGPEAETYSRSRDKGITAIKPTLMFAHIAISRVQLFVGNYRRESKESKKISIN